MQAQGDKWPSRDSQVHVFLSHFKGTAPAAQAKTPFSSCCCEKLYVSCRPLCQEAVSGCCPWGVGQDLLAGHWCPSSAEALCCPVPAHSVLQPPHLYFQHQRKNVVFFLWLTLYMCLLMQLSFQWHPMRLLYRLSCSLMYCLSSNKAQLHALLLF